MRPSIGLQAQRSQMDAGMSSSLRRSTSRIRGEKIVTLESDFDVYRFRVVSASKGSRVPGFAST